MTWRHTNYFSEQAKLWQLHAEQQPNSRGAAFYAAAFAGYEGASRVDDALSSAQDAGELLDLRFTGPRTERGTLPMGHFLDIMTPLNRAFNHAAYRLRGGKVANRVNLDIKDEIALQMAGTGYGSARVFVTGDAREDLTGISLLGETFKQTFQLLNAKSDAFFDAVNAVGGTAARHFGQALHHTQRHGLAAEFNWLRPNEPLSWNGTTSEISRVCSLIEGTAEPETFEEILIGHVSATAETGNLQLRIGQDRTKVRFPITLIDQVQRLALGKDAKLRVQTARYWDAVLQKDVLKHTLIGVDAS